MPIGAVWSPDHVPEVRFSLRAFIRSRQKFLSGRKPPYNMFSDVAFSFTFLVGVRVTAAVQNLISGSESVDFLWKFQIVLGFRGSAW